MTTRREGGYSRQPLTIAAYIQAGRPDVQVKPFGSFEEWSGLVRSALVWCGLPDPCVNGEYVSDDDNRETVVDLIASNSSSRTVR